MTEETENLVLEHLRSMRAPIARVEDKVDTMRAEMTAVRQQLGAVLTLQDHDHTDIAVIKSRIDRIERRLDLVD